MTTMVERVAEAILAATDEAMFPDDALKCARAAIEAMREPSEAGQRAFHVAVAALDRSFGEMGRVFDFDQAQELILGVFKALDAAGFELLVKGDDHE